jgi:serine/threonine protein kinase
MGERDLDHRVDIYALGCVGYWLLSGRTVFDGDTPVKMMLEHVRKPPAPPSARSELPIPPDLDALILACLAKRPEDRPADALELARRLEGCDVGEPWTSERAHAWWQTHAPETGVPRTSEPWEASRVLTVH